MYTLKKSLGQHFLHDENICQRIVASVHLPSGDHALLEVGPGGGAITKYLLVLPGVNYKAIEIDTEKVEYLSKQYPDIIGKLINDDILRATIPFDGRFALIGNFPYNISSQILFRVLDWREQVTEVVGMFQKEVARRIASPPGTKDYGILSVLIQAFFSVDYLFDVPPGCFNPPPKVMSGVIRLTNIGNPHGILNMKRFTMIVKAAFGQRRKTLRNALKSTFPPDVVASHPLMHLRAEQLSVNDFVGLYRLL